MAFSENAASAAPSPAVFCGGLREDHIASKRHIALLSTTLQTKSFVSLIFQGCVWWKSHWLLSLLSLDYGLSAGDAMMGLWIVCW
jgi:hypothetical protein